MNYIRKTFSSIVSVYLFLGLIICSQSFQISPGQGYSFVTDDIAPVKCFRLSSLQTTGQQGRLELSSAYTSDSLATELGIEATMKAGISKFSGDAMVQYMNSIVEDSMSFSLNYFYKIWHTVEMTFPVTKDELLSNEGKAIYGDGTASNFRTLCGEQLIRSYEEGAVVIFSLKMNFQTKTQKEQFEAQLNINTGFLDITSQLTSISTQTQISGTLAISAYQLGGNPVELATVLSPQIIQCSFSDLSACQETLVNSIDYIQTQFPAQLQQSDASGLWQNPLVALGSYTVAPEYITNYGIQLPPNPLTWEIINARNDLLNAYRRNKLNELNLESLQEQGYGPHIQYLDRFIYNIKKNINTINNGVLSGPASSCWHNLEHCIIVRDEIIANLIPFTFDPDTVRFCNQPDIGVEDWCGTKYPEGFRYEYGAYWNIGTYMNNPNVAGADGKCTANAMGRFSREKRCFLCIFGGRDWTDMACGETVYDSVIDPTFNWLHDLDDVSSPLFSSWGTNSGELIDDQINMDVIFKQSFKMAGSGEIDIDSQGEEDLYNEELEFAGPEENQEEGINEEELNLWN